MLQQLQEWCACAEEALAHSAMVQPIQAAAMKREFQRAETRAMQKIRALLGELISLDSIHNGEILFYDEKESCMNCLVENPKELSTDIIVLLSFAEAAKKRWEERNGEAPGQEGKRKIKRISNLLNGALEAIDVCLKCCRATGEDAAGVNGLELESRAVMRLFFLIREVGFQNKFCGDALLSEEETQLCQNLLAALQVCCSLDTSQLDQPI
jgi:hypothetical protein